MPRSKRRKPHGRWRKPECSSDNAAWRTRGEALNGIARLIRQDRQATVPSGLAEKDPVPYLCNECHAWHLKPTK